MTYQGQALQFVMTHGGPNLGLAGEQNRTQRLALGVRQGQRRLHTGPDNKGNPVGLQPGEKLAVMEAPVGPQGTPLKQGSQVFQGPLNLRVLAGGVILQGLGRIGPPATGQDPPSELSAR